MSVSYPKAVYCDFSCYTDISRGVGKVLGIDLLYNFNLPYFSRGPSEFWQRWHISLSSWLRDYLCIPLGGNRRGPGRTYVNLMITVVLGGLWHGAAWNFVVWGFYQWAVLCAYRMLAPGSAISVPPTHPGPVPERGWRERPLASAASLALFFVLTCYGWLLFRASSLDQVLRYTGTLFADRLRDVVLQSARRSDSRARSALAAPPVRRARRAAESLVRGL